jgi:uncharacterized surface protein with fasciclin (FAS1) repeats
LNWVNARVIVRRLFTAKVTIANVMQSNGVIMVIDKVLMPS